MRSLLAKESATSSTLVLLVAVLASCLSVQAKGAQNSRLLIPRFTLVQTAPPDQRYDQKADQARINLITQHVRAAFTASKRYHVLNRGPHDRRPPYPYTDCHACIYDWAKSQGADYVLVGWVQKESRLILFISMALLNVHTHQVVQSSSLSLRDDTNAMWLHGADYLLRHKFHVAPDH